MIATYVPLIGILIAAGLAATLGLRNYSKQKDIGRRNDLKKMRMEDYKRLLEAYVDTIPSSENPIETTPQEYLKAQLDLFVVASDEVVRRAGELQGHLVTHPPSSGSRDVEHIKNLFTAMFRAMREDCFEITEISDEEISRLSPIS